ncbi:MAG: protein-export chaperone SecB [Lachnospiraceae bacterium]|nr:protein-export chaperone SecB [Lachnospiraceae bacterium]
MGEKKIESVLRLQHCVFDEISFMRKGFKNSNEATFRLGASIRKTSEHNYAVILVSEGMKENEYVLNIRMTGYFTIEGEISAEEENKLIKSNAVAVLLPYMRSEISLLTCQPETQCETLPIINVYNMMDANENTVD